MGDKNYRESIVETIKMISHKAGTGIVETKYFVDKFKDRDNFNEIMATIDNNFIDSSWLNTVIIEGMDIDKLRIGRTSQFNIFDNNYVQVEESSNNYVSVQEPTNSAGNDDSDIEVKLEKLKRLFDKELISQEEYNEKRKEILGL